MLEQDEDLDNDIDEVENNENEYEPEEETSGSRHFTYKSHTSSIKNLKRDYDENDLRLNPEFQRQYVWNKKYSSKLIESILINIPIPAIFIARKSDGKADVIDGQQRLTTLFKYMNNEFKLQELSNKDFNSKFFKDLSEKEQNYIKNYNLLLIEIDVDKQPDAMYEMFERINNGSVKLNPQEIRNSIYRGDYNNFIKELAKTPSFIKTIGGNKKEQEKRMVYEELVLLFFTVIEIFPKSKFGVKSSQLNKQMEINTPYNSLRQEGDKRIFESTFNLILDIFGETAFAPFVIKESTKEIVKTSPKGSTQFNRGLYVVMVYIFSRNRYDKNMFRGKKDIIFESIKSLMIDDGEFKDITIQGSTMDAKRVSRRLAIFDDIINKIMEKEEETPRAFTYAFREELFSKSQVCAICQQKINSIDQAEVDHILAWVKGGKTVPENAQLTHYYCNRMKSSN